MKRSIARKWIKALESGEYKQCKGQLRKGDSFCCLGVLCNLHAQEHPDVAAEQRYKNSYMGNVGVLPDAVMAWAGAMDDCGFMGSGVPTLAMLNDTEGFSFPEIAKVVRKEWKTL